MSQFVRTKLRCAMNPARVGDEVFRTVNGTSPIAIKGAGLDFEFLLWDGTDPLDISNIGSLSVMLKPTGTPEVAPSALKTTNVLTQVASLDTWRSGAEQHVVVIFSGTEMNIAAGVYDVTVYGITTDDALDTDCFGRTTLKLVDAGLTNTTQPSVGLAAAVSVDQLNQVFAQCLKKVMDPGDVLTLRSKNGRVARILGAGNDYEKIDDLEDT